MLLTPGSDVSVAWGVGYLLANRKRARWEEKFFPVNDGIC
jgi:hypothetical protein